MDVKSFSCGESLDIASSQSLYSRLAELIASGADVAFDASHVEKADTAGLQVMLLAILEMEKHEQNVTWINPSQRLQATAKNLGLSAALRLPE